MSMQIYDQRYDVSAEWEINRYCNFKCQHCFYSADKKRGDRAYIGHEDIEKIVGAFNATGITWLIGMVGGEPFLHPDFIHLCEELTKKHYLSIATNLSTDNLREFCKTIDPKRIDRIHASLHIIERERLGLARDFIEKVRIVKDAGIRIYTTQVMWPPLVGRFETIFNTYEKEGVVIRPKLFRGFYSGRYYPREYSKKEKELILYFSRKAEEKERIESERNLIYFGRNSALIEGPFSFKGLPCFAGRRFVTIDYDGNVRRCSDHKQSLGNLYEGTLKLLNRAEVCKVGFCGCPTNGMMFAVGKPERLSWLKIFIDFKLKPKLRYRRRQLERVLSRFYFFHK